MQAYLSLLRRFAVIRASALALLLYGFAGAATAPYQSVIGVRELGLSDTAYALVALAAAVANVVCAVGIGLMSDHFQSYRRPLILSSGIGVLGYGAIWAFATPAVFAVAVTLPLALFHATNSLLFGNVRAHSADLTPDEVQTANALMRTMISLSWVVVPGLVGLALSGSGSMIAAYLISALVAAGCFATVVFGMDRDRRPAPPRTGQPGTGVGGTGTATVAPTAGRPDRPAQVRLRRPAIFDLALIAAPGTALRILGVALITQVLTVNGTVLPLILTGQAGGRAEQIGLTVGMVAVIEVIFMLVWAHVARRMALTRALAISAGLYLIYLALLAGVVAPWQVYAVSVIGGIGAAGIISLPITYLLDLISDRPGLSASLIAVNMFLGAAFGSLIFAAGSALAGYPGAAIMGGLAGIIGAGLLVFLERGRT